MSRYSIACLVALCCLSLGSLGCGDGGSETTVVPAEPVSDDAIKQMELDSAASRKQESQYD